MIKTYLSIAAQALGGLAFLTVLIAAVYVAGAFWGPSA